MRSPLREFVFNSFDLFAKTALTRVFIPLAELISLCK